MKPFVTSSDSFLLEINFVYSKFFQVDQRFLKIILYSCFVLLRPFAGFGIILFSAVFTDIVVFLMSRGGMNG